MGGIIGRFFYQFGMTVAWAVLVSLFVSFTLTPMLAAWWGVDPHVAGADGHGSHGNVLTRGIAKFNTWFDKQAGKYRRVIEWALGHRKTTILMAVASLVGAFMLFPLIGGGFMPDMDNSEFTVSFETLEGPSLVYTRQKAEAIGQTIRSLQGVDYTYTTVGAGVTGTVTAGNVYVKLVPIAEREKSQDDLMVEARQKLGQIFG